LDESLILELLQGPVGGLPGAAAHKRKFGLRKMDGAAAARIWSRHFNEAARHSAKQIVECGILNVATEHAHLSADEAQKCVVELVNRCAQLIEGGQAQALQKHIAAGLCGVSDGLAVNDASGAKTIARAKDHIDKFPTVRPQRGETNGAIEHPEEFARNIALAGYELT
jgi:hypothetical protein